MTVGKVRETAGGCVPVKAEGKEFRKLINIRAKSCPLDLVGVVTDHLDKTSSCAVMDSGARMH